MAKIAIFATHPIQYQVPLFQFLHQHYPNYEFQVIYFFSPTKQQQGVGFNQAFSWDLPLLEGYDYKFLKKQIVDIKTQHWLFKGIRIRSANKLIKEINTDIIFVTGWHSLALVQIAIFARLHKIPILVRGESNGLKPLSLFKKIRTFLILKLYRRYLYIGKSNLRYYHKNKIHKQNLFFSPYIVDNQKFKAQSKISATLRQELLNDWNLDGGLLTLGFVGKFEPKKHLMDLLISITKLPKHFNLQLLIVGSGEGETQAKSFCKESKINACFTGFLNQNEIAKAYAIMDVMILPSDYDETWGLVVNEAMASATPCLVSNRAGCHWDLIIEDDMLNDIKNHESQQTGWVFEFIDENNEFNHPALASKIEQIYTLFLKDKSKLKKIGINAQQHILQHYSIEHSAKGVIQAIESLQ